MFGNVLDKLDSWLGRSFLVASFFPFLIFGVANAVMAQFLLPDQLRTLISLLSNGYFGTIDATFLLLASCGILAYITNPLVRLMTNAIRGQYFFRTFERWLISEKSRDIARVNAEETRLGLIDGGFGADKVVQLEGELRAAREKGVTIGAILNRTLIDRAWTSIQSLDRKRARGELILFDELQQPADKLKEALERNCSDGKNLTNIETRGLLDRLCKPSEKAMSERLQKQFVIFMDIIEYAGNKAKIQFTKAVNEANRIVPAHEILPTTFGNKYAALSSYFGERFSIDIDFILPILQMVVQADKAASDALANSQQQLDFAIRTFLFIIIFTAFWLVAAALEAKSIWVIPTLGTGGLIAAALVFEIIQASFRSFSEVFRAVCILNRFAVLNALHMELPSTWEEEKQLWDNINRQLQWSSEAVIKYRHPTK